MSSVNKNVHFDHDWYHDDFSSDQTQNHSATGELADWYFRYISEYTITQSI